MAEKNTEETSNVWMVRLGILVAGIIVGFVIGWFWQENASDVLVVGDSQNGTSTAALDVSAVPVPEVTYQTIDAPSSVSVDDQRAGSLVFIKNVEVSKPSWIAVREIVDGSIGNILGAGMITGATDDVPVTLLRATKTDGQYAVFIYQDDGDGQFDSKKDPLVMQDSMPVAAMFTAQ